jgi:serine/threonine protein kinase
MAMSDPSRTQIWQAPTNLAAAELPAIPGYEILEELGRGGMGVVYKARHSSQNRLVALKLIRDGALASQQERARFRVEADAAGRMRHSHIVEVYESGEHQGQPFFAMELVEGGTLDKHLTGEPIPADSAARLIRALALAVQHAHEQKIVHRDLKPANILLHKPDGIESAQSSTLRSLISSLTPKVSDFGLAKRLDGDCTVLTQTGAVLGTASYMAPEQAAGRIHEIGPAVDIYALGAILFELLTGKRPFHGDSWNQTIQQVIHDEPPLPTRLHAGVPQDLETVCLKCLEKNPARRYASARELAEELGRFLDNSPVIAAPLDETERLTRLAARDGFQIIAEIGRGPSGSVYRAVQGPLKQPVALKVFPARMLSRDEWDSRVRRSAELWAALAHPNIVGMQRAGWWDGRPYICEEFVPQGNLASQLMGRPVSLDRALRLVEQLAEIVVYIHRQGMVHGNLKPSNVLFAADGIPRVVDFRPPVGLAPHGSELESRSLVYLAPELIDDPHAEARPHTDIYGLGVILYELLTGRAPFSGTNADELRAQVRAQMPVAPSQFNREVTPPLDSFCLRCLWKNPWRRYYRAYDVQKRLQGFREGPQGGGVR